MDNDILIDTEDYAGRRVVLHANRWETHVLLKHPEMIGCLRQAENTLRDPSFVQQGRNPRTVLYFQLGAIDRFRNLYLVVVVRHDLQPAQVRTMYLTREPASFVGRLVYVKARR